MPTPSTIKTETPPLEKSAEEVRFESLVNEFDGSLTNLAHSIGHLFTRVWGTPDAPRDPAEIEAELNVDPVAAAKLFTAHAPIVQALADSGTAIFFPWETVPAYAVTFADDLSSVTVARELAQEWVDAAS